MNYPQTFTNIYELTHNIVVKCAERGKTSFQHYNLERASLYPREKIHMFSHAICVVNTFLSSPEKNVFCRLLCVFSWKIRKVSRKSLRSLRCCEEDLTQHRSSLNGFEGEFPSAGIGFRNSCMSSRDLTLHQLPIAAIRLQKHFHKITVDAQMENQSHFGYLFA